MNPIDLIVTVCAVLAPTTCEETHLVFFLARFVAAVCHGCAALHCAVGWRASEMERRCAGAANIRIATTRQMRAEQRPRADP